MTQDTKSSKGRKHGAAGGGAAAVPARVRQSFRIRGGCRRAAGRPQLAAAAAAWPLCRVDLRHLVHDRPGGKPAHLDLSHPAFSGAPALCAHRQRLDPQRAVPGGRCDPDAIALEPDADPEKAHRLHRRHRDHGRQRRRRDPGRHGGAHLRRQPLDDRPLLLQCGRRNADRAAAGPRPLRHRTRRDRGAARRDRRRSRAACASASNCRTGRRAATSARITAWRCGCRNSARSARTVSPIRATSSRRSPPTRTPRRPASWSPNSRATCGRRRWIIRRSTSSPGTAISRRTNTISPASW